MPPCHQKVTCRLRSCGSASQETAHLADGARLGEQVKQCNQARLRAGVGSGCIEHQGYELVMVCGHAQLQERLASLIAFPAGQVLRQDLLCTSLPPSQTASSTPDQGTMWSSQARVLIVHASLQGMSVSMIICHNQPDIMPLQHQICAAFAYDCTGKVSKPTAAAGACLHVQLQLLCAASGWSAPAGAQALSCSSGAQNPPCGTSQLTTVTSAAAALVDIMVQ